MDLIRINEVVENFGISSRTLRYYEEMGLLWSNHPDYKTQRYYDPAALERLKQIIILRKLQIPIKDIVIIFKSENMTTLIQSFVNKLESLDAEISTLSELRHLVDDFLNKMLMSGIKKISGITLLYEETDKRLATVKRKETVTFEKLSEISREALRLHDVRIIRLPPMRVLTSRLKTFTGGLFAIASSFMEDMDDTLILLKNWINMSEDYELDVYAKGEFQRYEMIEEILPWDIANKLNRYQQDIFIPIQIKN